MGTPADVGVGDWVDVVVDACNGVTFDSTVWSGNGMEVCVPVTVGVAVKIASALMVDGSRLTDSGGVCVGTLVAVVLSESIVTAIGLGGRLLSGE